MNRLDKDIRDAQYRLSGLLKEQEELERLWSSSKQEKVAYLLHEEFCPVCTVNNGSNRNNCVWPKEDIYETFTHSCYPDVRFRNAEHRRYMIKADNLLRNGIDYDTIVKRITQYKQISNTPGIRVDELWD